MYTARSTPADIKSRLICINICRRPVPIPLSSLSRAESGRQTHAFGFFCKWDQRQSYRESNGRQGDRDADCVEMTHPGPDQERDSSSHKTSCGSRKGEGAGSALGSVLLGEPQRVHGKIGAPQSEEKQAHHEPGERPRFPVEDVTECYGDENHHQGKVKAQSHASS